MFEVEEEAGGKGKRDGAVELILKAGQRSSSIDDTYKEDETERDEESSFCFFSSISDF